jgi:cell division protein FtsW
VDRLLNKIPEFKGDRAIWTIVLFLALASLLAVYSAAGSLAYRYSGGNTEIYLLKHAFILGVSLVVTYFCYKLHYMKYSKLAPILLLLAVIMLVWTLIFGMDINDARRWIQVPVLNISFQTSDFAKLALIIYVARVIAIKQTDIKDFWGAFFPIILPIVIVCGLIAPADLSTAALLFATCMLMMFIGRIKLRYIGGLLLFGMLMFGVLLLIGYFFPEATRASTWVSRIVEFREQADGGYQIQQAKIAIARGEWFGVGPGNSIQRNYLPYPYADFIYAIICEEYGLLGGLVIIGLYLSLMWRCTGIVTKSPMAFGALLAMGLCLNLVIQAFSNIAVSVHLVPVTGLTLPFVSMGGTSILFTSVAFGIILSVSRYIELARKKQAMQEVSSDEGYH